MSSLIDPDEPAMNILGVLPYWQFGPWAPLSFLGLDGLKIHSFGLCVAIGLLIGLNFIGRRAQKKFNIENEAFQNYAIFLVIVGWPLSHVFNVIFYEPHVLLENPLELFRVWGSISSYGGLLGGVIALLIWRYRNPKERKRLSTWVELSVFGLVIPWFFGRIGCASVHDHPGALANDFWLWEKVLQPIFGGPDIWPLAINFPAHTAASGLVRAGGPRHDLGLYEAIWWGLILLVILILDRKPRPKLFFAGLIPLLYAPGRFMFDFLRVPPELGGDARYLGLTPAQYFSLAIFALGIYILASGRGNKPVTWQEWQEEPAEASDAKDSDAKATKEEKKKDKKA